MKTKPHIQVHIRWMIRRDMPEVLDIERSSFEFAWLEEDFIRTLRQRNSIGYVAEHEERVVAFMLIELEKSSFYVLNVAVHPDFRNRRIGGMMLQKLKDKLSTQRRTKIHTHVREKNFAAQMWMKANGFIATEISRDHYDISPEDAYLFEYFLE